MDRGLIVDFRDSKSVDRGLSVERSARYRQLLQQLELRGIACSTRGASFMTNGGTLFNGASRRG